TQKVRNGQVPGSCQVYLHCKTLSISYATRGAAVTTSGGLFPVDSQGRKKAAHYCKMAIALHCSLWRKKCVSLERYSSPECNNYSHRKHTTGVLHVVCSTHCTVLLFFCQHQTVKNMCKIR